MSSDEEPTIGDDQRSPAGDAADDVEFGPSAVNEQDKQRPEPPGAGDLPEGAEPDSTVPPARSHH